MSYLCCCWPTPVLRVEREAVSDYGSIQSPSQLTVKKVKTAVQAHLFLPSPLERKSSVPILVPVGREGSASERVVSLSEMFVSESTPGSETSDNFCVTGKMTPVAPRRLSADRPLEFMDRADESSECGAVSPLSQEASLGPLLAGSVDSEAGLVKRYLSDRVSVFS